MTKTQITTRPGPLVHIECGYCGKQIPFQFVEELIDGEHFAWAQSTIPVNQAHDFSWSGPDSLDIDACYADRYVTTKVTLLGPAPYGGSLTADLRFSTDMVAEALASGSSIKRVWQVWQIGGKRVSVDI